MVKLFNNEPISRCLADLKSANFVCKEEFLIRLVASMATKPLVILTGLSGSGKTKIAQLFAKWLSPEYALSDPFTKGAKVGISYRVMDTDRISVELWNSKDEKVVLPRKLIDEWANFIESNPELKDLESKEIRDKFKKAYELRQGEKFAKHAILWDSHLKPAALAVIDRKKAHESPQRTYEVVAVGADWTSNEHVLGYPDGLDRKRYVRTKILDLVLDAQVAPETPFFLILDEMNLSHVERYFADFLSAIESGEEIHLHSDGDSPDIRDGVPSRIKLPPNLFVVGTVNIDETTYMFSPKVLDRANVIEFRMDRTAMVSFLENPDPVDTHALTGRGKDFSTSFLRVNATRSALTEGEKLKMSKELMRVFHVLEACGREFGYRVAKEISTFVGIHKNLSDADWDVPSALDAQIIQKILPKLHGTRNQLEPILWGLGILCHTPRGEITEPDLILKRCLEAVRLEDESLDPLGEDSDGNPNYPVEDAYFPLSFDKIVRMLRSVQSNGFTSFAEA